MNWLDLTLPDLAENLALDEALLLGAEAGDMGEVLRVWEWTDLAVVLGAGCRVTEDVNEAACRADRVPILRRSSGGGTVLLGRGCLLYSLVLRYDRSPLLREIPSSYTYILGKVAEALGGRSAGVEHLGTSDLAVTGRKFSGNAQQRKRRFLLHHGTLLYDFDLAGVGRYLHLPRRQPYYRQERDHVDFLRNVSIPAAALKRRLRSAWEADRSLKTWPEDQVHRLVEQKYSQVEWVNRRS